MKYRHAIQQDDGVALIMAAIFAAMALIIITALGMRLINANRLARTSQYYAECYNGVQSAYAASVASLESGGNGNIGLGTWAPPAGATTIVLPSFTADAATLAPVHLQTNPAVKYVAYADNWSNDGLDNNRNGIVDDITEKGSYTIYAMAEVGGVIRRTEAVVNGRNVNVWQNAVFAGSGQSGGLINGNVSIHGSVHLLGTSLLSGSIAVDALDLSGASLIHNAYDGVPAILAARVPALPTRVFGGETVQTLNASLRVAHGLVGINGSSEIGAPNVTGNNIKETLDGTYVTDGWTGNKTTPDGGRGIPGPVYSDNGYNALYDLGSKVPMPMFNDIYHDPTTGATVTNPLTGSPYTFIQYYHNVLAQTPYPTSMTIQADQNFYYNASHPTQTDPSLRLPTDNYIYYNAATNVLKVNGNIEINGDLNISRGAGNQGTILYTGRATLLAHGDVTLDTDLVTQNADGTTALSFPKNNILGIMAGGNMTVGSDAQLQLMGAFYAQGQVYSAKQTTTMGTFVSNYFNMGSNVPAIYQVPTLADNLPGGMIGMGPIMVYKQISWRELPK